jgi:hypothetical protein
VLVGVDERDHDGQLASGFYEMGGLDFASSEKAGYGMEDDGSEHIFLAQIFQDFQMQGTMMPGVALGEIDGDLNGHRLELCHSADCYLQPSGKRGATQDGGQAERVAGYDVDANQ